MVADPMTWFFILITMQTCSVLTFSNLSACETKRAEIVAQFEERAEYISLCSPKPLPKVPEKGLPEKDTAG